MKSMNLTVGVSNIPAVLSSCWKWIGNFPTDMLRRNRWATTESLRANVLEVFEEIVESFCLRVIHELISVVPWNFFEVFLRIFFFQNFLRTSCSVVSRLMCNVCQISMAFSLRKLREKCSFFSSVGLFWNGRLWIKSYCYKSLYFSWCPLKIGTWVCRSFILVSVMCSCPGRSVIPALTWFIWSSESSSEASFLSMPCSHRYGKSAKDDLLWYRCWVGRKGLWRFANPSVVV